MEKLRFTKGICVSDPCYVLSDKVYKEIWGNEHQYEDGVIEDIMMVHSTIIGDGCYPSKVITFSPEFESSVQRNVFFPVDSGTIAVINCGCDDLKDKDVNTILCNGEYIYYDGSGYAEISVKEDKKSGEISMYVFIDFDNGISVGHKIEICDPYDNDDDDWGEDEDDDEYYEKWCETQEC